MFSPSRKLAGGAVQGGKKLVLYVNVGTGQAVGEGGLARIGIAYDSHLKDVVSFFSLAFPGVLDFGQFLFQFLDTLADHSPVRFQLGFAGSLGADASVVLAAKVGPGSCEAGHHVLELSNLYHQAAFCRDGVLGENVQNQARTVQHLDSRQALFQVAHLGARKVVVKNHHFGVQLG